MSAAIDFWNLREARRLGHRLKCAPDLASAIKALAELQTLLAPAASRQPPAASRQPPALRPAVPTWRWGVLLIGARSEAGVFYFEHLVCPCCGSGEIDFALDMMPGVAGREASHGP